MDKMAEDGNPNKKGSFLTPDVKESEPRSFAPWIISGIVVLVIAGLIVVFGSRNQKGSAAGSSPDPYASKLTISAITLSQSSNMAGSQITYVDGTITNLGDRVVNGVSVKTTFHVPGGEIPQVETSALSLIRTRDPYVDIEPVSADPIKPGQSKDFRLIFDHVSPEWDQQNPEIRVWQVHF